MLCRSFARSSSLIQTRTVSVFAVATVQLRKFPSGTTLCARGFAQYGGGKGGGQGGKSGGGAPPKKPMSSSVKVEFEGQFHTVDVPCATFFEDAPDIIAEKIGEDIESLSFEIKTKSGDWMDLDDAPEDEKNRSKIEMKANRAEPEPEDEEQPYSDIGEEGDGDMRNEDAILAVEDLATAAVSEGKVKKGSALTAEAARAWVISQSELNEDVRTYVLNTVGGFDHLVQCLQFPFTFTSCFEDAPANPSKD